MNVKVRIAAAAMAAVILGLANTPSAHAQNQVVRLKNVAYGKCLYFNGAGRHVGTASCGKQTNQRFEIQWWGDGKPRVYNLDYQLCLNIFGKQDTEAEAGSCGNQTSKLHLDGGSKIGDTTRIYFLYGSDKFCLDYHKDVLSWGCSSTDRQKWEIVAY
ncbi:RICIN domain-containing protein [Kitasatospora sp. NPDC089509]|uniref:RICIN domain-containing protein n=1 Tax=Kitasatospora sp. NPDC089509 TaxID=3364079 RepID=UPI00380EC153